MTPEEFEREVATFFRSVADTIEDRSVTHRENIAGVDGSFEIDVVVRFTVFGASYTTLVECKHYSRPVGREKAQALHSKVLSTGAQKGILFSTSGFQSGAIEFARIHGIALVEVTDGRVSYCTLSDSPAPTPTWVPKHVCWVLEGQTRTLVGKSTCEGVREILGLNKEQSSGYKNGTPMAEIRTEPIDGD